MSEWYLRYQSLPWIQLGGCNIAETEMDGGEGYGDQYDVVLDKQQQSGLFPPLTRSSSDLHRQRKRLVEPPSDSSFSFFLSIQKIKWKFVFTCSYETVLVDYYYRSETKQRLTDLRVTLSLTVQLLLPEQLEHKFNLKREQKKKNLTEKKKGVWEERGGWWKAWKCGW